MAQAQTQQNKETAIAQANLSRINQYTPYGNLTYQVVGTNSDGTPRYQQTQTLSGSGQRQLDNQNALAEQLGGFAQGQVSRVQDQLAQNFNFNGAPGQVGSLDLSNLPALRNNIGVQDMTRSIGSAGDIQRSLNFSGAPGLPGANDFSAERDRVTDAVYNQATSRLDPQFNQQKSDLAAALANKGIAEGSEAYNREQGNYDRSRTDAYNDALYRAIGAGGQEQSRLFSDALAARQQSTGETAQQGQFTNTAQGQQYDQNAQNAAFYNAAGESLFQQNAANSAFGNAARTQGYNEQAGNAELTNAARQQWINEASYLRNLPLNDIATLMGTAGGVNQPNFEPVASVNMANTDLMGAVYDSYNGQMNAWSANNANQQAKNAGIFNALGTGAGMVAMSDARIKHALERIGTTVRGIPTYLFSYLGSGLRHFGVMAQDVMHIPGAVIDVNGTLAVDYRKVW